jgi:hypothetical protein
MCSGSMASSGCRNMVRSSMCHFSQCLHTHVLPVLA